MISHSLLAALKVECGSALRVSGDPDDAVLEDWFETELAHEIQARQTPGKAIRIYRENNRWTQAALGEKIGVKASFVSDLENGRREVSKKMAHLLAKLFETSVERFV